MIMYFEEEEKRVVFNRNIIYFPAGIEGIPQEGVRYQKSITGDFYSIVTIEERDGILENINQRYYLSLLDLYHFDDSSTDIAVQMRSENNRLILGGPDSQIDPFYFAIVIINHLASFNTRLFALELLKVYEYLFNLDRREFVKSCYYFTSHAQKAIDALHEADQILAKINAKAAYIELDNKLPHKHINPITRTKL